MRILAVECSAGAASCCIFEDGHVLSSGFCNVALTHSQTLLPMIENVLSAARVTLDTIDRFAIAAGPGSFTGVRIGVGAIKGLAAAKGTPCAAVSTLEAMAHLFTLSDGLVCPIMDARCKQVYTALFCINGGVVTRLKEDRAIAAEQLREELCNLGERVIIVGDGADMFMRDYTVENAVLAPPHLRFQNALGVAFAAENAQTVPPRELLPIYLRLPQAERELKKRKEENR